MAINFTNCRNLGVALFAFGGVVMCAIFFGMSLSQRVPAASALLLIEWAIYLVILIYLRSADQLNAGSRQ